MFITKLGEYIFLTAKMLQRQYVLGKKFLISLGSCCRMINISSVFRGRQFQSSRMPGTEVAVCGLTIFSIRKIIAVYQINETLAI